MGRMNQMISKLRLDFTNNRFIYIEYQFSIP